MAYTQFMNHEKWQQLISRLQSRFPGSSLNTEELYNIANGQEIQSGTQDIFEFSAPEGQFRIVRENKPLLLDKKMHFSHRQGDSARTEYIFSDTEMSHKILMFRQDDSGNWQKIDADASRLF